MWNSPIASTSTEQTIAVRNRETRKFFVSLREHRSELLDVVVRPANEPEHEAVEQQAVELEQTPGLLQLAVVESTRFFPSDDPWHQAIVRADRSRSSASAGAGSSASWRPRAVERWTRALTHAWPSLLSRCPWSHGVIACAFSGTWCSLPRHAGGSFC